MLGMIIVIMIVIVPINIILIIFIKFIIIIIIFIKFIIIIIIFIIFIIIFDDWKKLCGVDSSVSQIDSSETSLVSW